MKQIFICCSIIFLFASVLALADDISTVQKILNSEALESGPKDSAAAFDSAKLLPAVSMNAGDRAQKILEANAAITSELELFVQNMQAGGPAGACSALAQYVGKNLPLGMSTSNDTRAENGSFLGENSFTRTCWQDAAGANMVSELRNVFFIKKHQNMNIQEIFGLVTVFDRSPNTAQKFHYYEYEDPTDVANSPITALVSSELPTDPLEFDRSYLIKKCMTIELGAGFNFNKYCNTMLHRSYQISDSLYAITTQLYDLSKGDVKIEKDAYDDDGYLEAFTKNTMDGYSNIDLVAEFADYIAVFSLGLQTAATSCPDSFRAQLSIDSMGKEALLLREMITSAFSEPKTEVLTCADFK